MYIRVFPKFWEVSSHYFFPLGFGIPNDSIQWYIWWTPLATYSSTLAWKLAWMEEPGRLQSMGSLRVGYDWTTSLSLSCIGEGNGNPLQCSCLENPRDWGAWWAAVYGDAQSRTWLKWLSSSNGIQLEAQITLHLEKYGKKENAICHKIS